MAKKTLGYEKKESKDKANIELALDVTKDFKERKAARKNLELQWQLNIDFVNGKQNNYISKFDTVISMGKQFYWQEREVYNHILPMLEARLGKLAKSRPELKVIPNTADSNSEVVTKIIKSVFAKPGFENMIEQANLWSEMTGTAFYKIIWDNDAGAIVGNIGNREIAEGDVKVLVCSPFEIYPDSLTANDINECRSIIHAKTYPTALVKEIWGQKVSLEDTVLVIERYEMPSALYPNGQLVIVSNNKLLYKGELPYINQSGGKRGFPFVRQCSEFVAASFYGRSVIERAIPVQRAYNAIKNRKAEFVNRLACGVLSVEEGSVDLDSLEQDGLAPGKVIVYRQGAQAPKFMDCGGVPAEIEREEERLLAELAKITGGIDLARAAGESTVSGVALQILVEQDNLRMTRAAESVSRAVAFAAAQVLRLYKQFAANGRLAKVITENVIESFYWNPAEMTSDEVIGV